MPPPDACAPSDGLGFVCGLRNPEDLAAIPGGDWLIVSEMVRPGRISLVPLGGGAPVRAFPNGAAVDAAEDSDCPSAPDPQRFAPHGIDLDARADGSLALYVVNHGSREAVERFSIDAGSTPPSVTWIDCVPLPAGTVANDVAALPAGGFVVTKMFDSTDTELREKRAAGIATGYVLEWNPRDGLRQLPGSEASSPNGIAVSPDGRFCFVSAWSSRELLRIARAGDEPVRRVALPFSPDNVSWRKDGMLLVTGQRAPSEAVSACHARGGVNCAIPFAVSVVDPITLEATERLAHDGRGFGGATVAVEVDGALWLGTFAGDRIARFPLAEDQNR